MAVKLSTALIVCFIAFLILANHIVSPRQLIVQVDGPVGGNVSPGSKRCLYEHC
ncbi:hypothetical protein I3843_11G040300 [Carya illinoinensis]|uniref:Uncharacterized protein n=1 Tax=Carya illinoinensis TaxID=32201 RepID=A0A8T1P252_CARIL|nr:hypothetical protein CIPAW_11G040400 [Carya illinoinensis]KAG7954834.1 hypothetical protein I3843_11G040300 [Carya illinoinensis]